MQSKRKLFTSLTSDTSLRRQVRNSIEILNRPIHWGVNVSEITLNIIDLIEDAVDEEIEEDFSWADDFI